MYLFPLFLLSQHVDIDPISVIESIRTTVRGGGENRQSVGKCVDRGVDFYI